MTGRLKSVAMEMNITKKINVIQYTINEYYSS